MIRLQTQNECALPRSPSGSDCAGKRRAGIDHRKLSRYVGVAVAVCALSLVGCGGSEERPIYAQSAETQPIQVPPELDQPETDAALRIPGESAPQLAGLREGATPPQVLSSEESSASSSVRYGFQTGALYLLIEDRPGSVWRRLGFTLNRRDMTLQARDESARTYEFRYTQPSLSDDGGGFWDTVLFWRGSDQEDYSGTYRVRLQPDKDQPGKTRVFLYRDEGSPAPAAAADHILGLIKQRLG